jgi:hypothetical protein
MADYSSKVRHSSGIDIRNDKTTTGASGFGSTL